MLYTIPEWFFNLGLGLEFLFAVLAAVIAFYSYKIYRISESTEVRIFGIGFSFIALSYIIKAGVNYLISNATSGGRMVSISELHSLNSLGVLSFISLFTLGLICLNFVTFKAKNYRLLSMMVIIGLLFVWLSGDVYFAFSILSAILTAFISIHYYNEYKERKNKRTMFVLSAFLLLFLSNLGFVIPGGYYSDFVIGHLLELGCYVLMILTLVKIKK